GTQLERGGHVVTGRLAVDEDLSARKRDDDDLAGITAEVLRLLLRMTRVAAAAVAVVGALPVDVAPACVDGADVRVHACAEEQEREREADGRGFVQGCASPILSSTRLPAFHRATTGTFSSFQLVDVAASSCCVTG